MVMRWNNVATRSEEPAAEARKAEDSSCTDFQIPSVACVLVTSSSLTPK